MDSGDRVTGPLRTTALWHMIYDMEIQNEFTNKIKDRLLSFLGNKNSVFLEKVAAEISKGYYSAFIIDDLFLKISAADNFHFTSLRNEILIGNPQYENRILKPKIMFSYYSENIVIKLEERIEAVPLGEKRDDFSIEIDYNKDKLIEKIKLISKVNVENKNNLSSYNRSNKILNRLNDCNEYIKPSLARKCIAIVNTCAEDKLYFSHGDLIPSNILLKDDDFIFIDWEWAAYRSETYDLTLFLLFSDTPYCAVSDFENYFDKRLLLSAYIDSVAISLREIKNWKAEKAYIKDKDERIKMWTLTLQQAVDLIERFS